MINILQGIENSNTQSEVFCPLLTTINHRYISIFNKIMKNTNLLGSGTKYEKPKQKSYAQMLIKCTVTYFKSSLH